MKTRFTLGLMALTIGFTLKAQTEPFDQFFYKSLWSNLPQYDSINIWFDTVSQANAYGGYHIDFGANGLIDTMYFKNHSSNTITQKFSNSGNGVNDTLISNYVIANGLVPYMRTIFHLDQSKRVSEVFLADYNINGYDQHSKLTVNYKANAKVESILYSLNAGTSYQDVSIYQYYYTGNRLDSVLDKWFYNGQAMQKYILEYDNAGELTGMRYYDDSGFGLEEYMRHKFVKSANNSLYDLIYVVNANGNGFYLNGVYEYLNTKNFGVGLPAPVMAQVNIYPNPTQGIVRISGKDLSTYKIHDFNGRALKEGKANGDINIDHLPGGTYLLTIWDKNGNSKTEKIVKLGF